MSYTDPCPYHALNRIQNEKDEAERMKDPLYAATKAEVERREVLTREAAVRAWTDENEAKIAEARALAEKLGALLDKDIGGGLFGADALYRVRELVEGRIAAMTDAAEGYGLPSHLSEALERAQAKATQSSAKMMGVLMDSITGAAA